MSIETYDHIISRLMLRELGFSIPPVDPKTASATEMDVEDSFMTLEEDLESQAIPPTNPDSEPE